MAARLRQIALERDFLTRHGLVMPDAEQRKWVVATDDRRAIRVAQQAGLTVVSCPELVKAWADATVPDRAALSKVLEDIQVLAQFKPNPTMPEYQWWVDELVKAGP
jgi:hypothetical protein